MIIALWLRGLVRRLPGRLIGTIAGIGLAVALLSSIGSFIAISSASMTQRVAAGVPVDWQVQLAPGADIHQVIAAVHAATKLTALQRVGYAEVAGFRAATGATVQTTGSGKALGIDPLYRRIFPAEVRPLIGSPDGVVLAQQTAANLHAGVGNSISIERIGLPPKLVRVLGIVDLPSADSLFQAVGLPQGVAPQAPPDNVIVLPATLWHKLFDPQALLRPDSVRTQLHVRITHDLPADPSAAYFAVQSAAKNFEVRIAGSGIVGDNLAARLLAAQSDSLYARVLFLFLGLPGVVLAGLLTLAIAGSGAERRRQDQALLRIRGASTAQILQLEAVEAVIVGVGGVGLGIALASLLMRSIAPLAPSIISSAPLWVGGAAAAGLALAVLALLYPAWKQARSTTVVSAFAIVGHAKTPTWQQIYLDVVLLVLSATVFWQMARTGYQIVLAPEGVPQTAVHYQAFIAPLFLWIGVGLLTMRIAESSLRRGRSSLTLLLHALARNLSAIVAASLSRQRLLLSRGILLVSLAVSFAVSTAVFNTTFNAQSKIDAELTNGSDVTVTAPPSSDLHQQVAKLRAISGVGATALMQHRFAYVGNDLQDMYGIDPLHIGDATNMSDAFFANGNARKTLAELATRPDGVLVSEETVRDFQLKAGDMLNLRLQHARDHRYHVVPFHFVGIVGEFPTAPKDSFLVANASYIAQQTGSNASSILLMRATADPATVAARARAVVASLAGAQVSDIASAQRAISSSLTAVDLRGLTGLELVFAVLFIAAATGLVLALGLAERRRTFAILSALGAKSYQLGAFVWSEAFLVLLGGVIVGAALGLGVAKMLVKLLTGVFDPPPESLMMPWVYLTILAAAAILSTAIAAFGALVALRNPSSAALRE